MTRYVALLGGINVGGHRVKMSDLRSLFEALALENVATFIASGNVIFESASRDLPRLTTRIERHLSDALGYRVPTFIRSLPELAEIAGHEPFAPELVGGGFHTLSVLFMSHTLPEDAGRTLLTFRTPVDEFHLRGREIYWLCRKKTTESLVDWPRLKKRIDIPPLTVRNMTTVRKLVAQYAGTTPAG